MKGRRVNCTQCGHEMSSFRIKHHERMCGGLGPLLSRPRKKRVAWNKGLTSDDPRVKANALAVGAVMLGKKRKPLLPEHRGLIAVSMKKAHADGRAHNIGQDRWKKKPSWPEQFFLNIIEKEFFDKNFVRELYFHGFVLDFAWQEKKKCLEIDGEQHELPDQKTRDERKNAMLKKHDWQVLRVPWKAVCADAHGWIQKTNEFIGV